MFFCPCLSCHSFGYVWRQAEAGEVSCVLHPILFPHRQDCHVPSVLQYCDTGRDLLVFPQQTKSTSLYRFEASDVSGRAGHPCQDTIFYIGMDLYLVECENAL